TPVYFEGFPMTRWIRYRLQNAAHYGLLDENDTITQVNGDPFAGYETTGTRLALPDVELLVPVVPPTFYAVGMNYVKHIKSQGEKSIPGKPDVGYRANNALVPHGHDVIMPVNATRVHYEGEL